MSARTESQIYSRSDAGFALIEALVSLILLATVLAMLPGTIKAGKRAWQAADAQSDAASVFSAISVAETRLQGAMPVFDRDQTGLPRLAFEGRADSVSFVAPFSEGPHRGGLYRLTLAKQVRQQAKGGVDLTVTLLPFERRGADGPAFETTAVLAELNDIGFRYFGPNLETGDLTWQPIWQSPDSLPLMVEMSVKAKSGSDVAPMVRRVELKLRPHL